MKKIKYLMVPLFVFLFILTGCGEKKEENKTNDTEKKENVKETIKSEENKGDSTSINQNGNIVYYSFGDSQTKYDNYLEMFKKPYYGGYMVIKYEESLDNTIKSICIYDNEKLTCFTDDGTVNNSLANYFGANNCGNTDNGYECHNNNFTCFKNNKGITCSSKMNGNCTGYVDQADNAMTMCY